MKVSIITCTWNSEPYIADSIRSVLSQDYPDIEYIFVDGGSTDGTLERIAAIPRPVKLLENVRGGISRAMNAGIEAATGEVIAHLHGDDYYLYPYVITQVVNKFNESGADWIIGRVVTDVEGRLIPQQRFHKQFSYAVLARGAFFIPHPSTFVSRKLLFEEGGFDETLRYAMDVDLWFRLAYRHKPTMIDADLAAFRQHSGSTSAATPETMLSARREDLMVRARYAYRAPIQTAICFVRYLLRIRRLKREIAADKTCSDAPRATR